MANNYPHPAAFRQALKDRMKARAEERGLLFNRYRQLVLFERFAARVYEACDSEVVVKGGLVMELRFERARTTRDIDAVIPGDWENQIEAIRRKAAETGDDWLSFQVGEADEFVEHEGEQIVYDAYRVDVQAQIGGKEFGAAFHFDVSTGEKLVEKPERTRGTDLFEFIGIEPLEHRVYPRETHVAEKLHAWSFPRERPNSRLKDLVDIALMADGLQFEYDRLRESIEATFEFRNTHSVPNQLPEVPASWTDRYGGLRDENNLSWNSVEEVTTLVRRFLEPVLRDDELGMWRPGEGVWEQI